MTTPLSSKAFSIAFLLGAMAVGCGGDSTPAPTTPTDGGSDVTSGPPQTFDYVLNTITIDGTAEKGDLDPATYTRGVSGFNLDGRFSGPQGADPADCSHGDFFSTLDSDQNMGTCTAGTARGGASCTGGVDNQLPAIAAAIGGFGTDIRAAITEQLTQGKLSILLRVSNVNGTPGPSLNDDSVNVSVFTIARPMFASCGMINTPGQSYAIDTAAQELTFTGRIVNGRLIINPAAASGMPNFTFTLPIMNMNLALGLYQTQLRASLTADNGTGGNLGGYIPLRTLTTTLAPLLPAGIPEATVRTVLNSLVDVQFPAGNAMGCSDPNGAIALGFSFTTVRANVQAARVTGAQAGMCGTSAM